ncbi:unnamed protein product [Penicillium roqueforti FM164]|uniref:Uncharacterized protein n=1 Tax=Penicillium roqueforti (strain FM164) TaxID=1365484 RepID=W6QWJ9_PENRF|nr:unnamed protein product [Penicillium roqueforti FM164]
MRLRGIPSTFGIGGLSPFVARPFAQVVICPSHNSAGPSSLLPPSSQADIPYIESPFDPNIVLQRVGPGRQKPYVLFNAINNVLKADFIDWWRPTNRVGDSATQ